jgi:hypothetical protein
MTDWMAIGAAAGAVVAAAGSFLAGYKKKTCDGAKGDTGPAGATGADGHNGKNGTTYPCALHDGFVAELRSGFVETYRRMDEKFDATAERIDNAILTLSRKL